MHVRQDNARPTGKHRSTGRITIQNLSSQTDMRRSFERHVMIMGTMMDLVTKRRTEPNLQLNYTHPEYLELSDITE